MKGHHFCKVNPSIIKMLDDFTHVELNQIKSKDLFVFKINDLDWFISFNQILYGVIFKNLTNQIKLNNRIKNIYLFVYQHEVRKRILYLFSFTTKALIFPILLNFFHYTNIHITILNSLYILFMSSRTRDLEINIKYEKKKPNWTKSNVFSFITLD